MGGGGNSTVNPTSRGIGPTPSKSSDPAMDVKNIPIFNGMGMISQNMANNLFKTDAPMARALKLQQSTMPVGNPVPAAAVTTPVDTAYKAAPQSTFNPVAALNGASGGMSSNPNIPQWLAEKLRNQGVT